jgi:hypothetical protein
MSLAPWCSAEKWEYVARPDGKVIATVTGRQRCPENLKTFTWGLRNDYEQNLTEAPWFEPDEPQAKREFDWAVRNPFQNARMFTLGWADRNYRVEVTEGRFDLPLLLQRDDIGEWGWQKCVLTLLDGSEARFYKSFAGPNLLTQEGMQPNGFYAGIKFVPRTFAFWQWYSVS